MYTIKKLQEIVTEEIRKEADIINNTEPLNLYQPISYTLNMGGKRLRPVMVLLSYNLFRQDIKRAYPVALAIEIFHNFTLLHDDIMDRADMRRNQASVHKKYSENTAILSGDAMSILSNNYLLRTDSKNTHELMSLFSKTAIEVCEGQQYDIDFEKRMDVSIAEYLTMIRLKTAVLIACSLKAGALVAEASEKTANLLYELGIKLGIAFQLQDDLLDVFADQEKFGKTIGGDIVSNKKTYMLLKALEIAPEKIKQQLFDWITKEQFETSEKIREVRNIYTELKVREIVQEKIDEYYRSACEILDKLDIAPEKKTELVKLSEIILNRDY